MMCSRVARGIFGFLALVLLMAPPWAPRATMGMRFRRHGRKAVENFANRERRSLRAHGGRRNGARATRAGDEPDQHPFCVLPKQPGFDLPVNVFADPAENTRYVSFGYNGMTDGDGYVETMVKCTGSLPAGACGTRNSTALGHDGSGGQTSSETECGSVSCPCEFDLNHTAYGNYQNAMLKYLTPECQKSERPGPYRILLIGLGGGALPQHILHACPTSQTQLETVEYDPRMIEVATRFFGLQVQPGVSEVTQGDGGEIVAQRAREGAKFDMILVDAFAGGPHVPESCRNEKFLRNAKTLLNGSGMMIHNIETDVDGTLPTYKKIFGEDNVQDVTLSGNGELPSRLIVAFSPDGWDSELASFSRATGS